MPAIELLVAVCFERIERRAAVLRGGGIGDVGETGKHPAEIRARQSVSPCHDRIDRRAKHGAFLGLHSVLRWSAVELFVPKPGVARVTV
jgi:hypothetical protein